MKFSPAEFAAFHQGDQRVFEDVVRRFASEIVAYFSLFTHNFDLAEEIAQDVFLRIYQRRRQFKENNNFKGWLFTIARNILMQELRKKRYTLERNVADFNHGSMTEPASHAPAPDKQLQRAQARKILLDGIAHLKQDDAEIIILRFFKGMSLKEIAGITGMPLGSVGVKIQRSLQALRAFFVKEGFSVDDLI